MPATIRIHGSRLRMAMRIPTTTIYVTHDQIEAMTLADRVVVMNKGRIEQIAPPEELYRHPATRFVAGFIGSPGMNFFDVTIEKSEAGLSLRLPEGQTLRVPESRHALFAAYAGKQMLVGIRPEHFTIAASDADATLDVAATLIEPLGMDTLVHFKMADAIAVSRLLPTPGLKAGARLKLAVDMAKVHLLDPSTDLVLG